MSNIFSAVGRIGRDAEVRSTQNGTSVAGFPVAIDVGFGDHKETLWLDCSLWGKRAEGGLVPYLAKGQQVHVIGEIGTREFQKRDGAPGFAVTLKLSEIDLVGAAPQGQQGYGQQQQQRPPQPQQGGQYGAPQPAQGQGQNFGAPAPGSFDHDMDSSIPF